MVGDCNEKLPPAPLLELYELYIQFQESCEAELVVEGTLTEVKAELRTLLKVVDETQAALEQTRIQLQEQDKQLKAQQECWEATILFLFICLMTAMICFASPSRVGESPPPALDIWSMCTEYIGEVREYFTNPAPFTPSPEYLYNPINVI